MPAVHDHTADTHKIYHKKTPSEIWDDDFEFQQNHESRHDHGRDVSSRQRKTSPLEKQATRWSAHDQTMEEYMNMEPGPSRIPMRAQTPPPARTSLDALRAWSESPTTPERRARQAGDEENWDDDFMDKADSPVRIQRTRHPPRHSNTSPSEDQENWDEDFEMGGVDVGMGSATRGHGTSPSSTKRSRNDTSWDSSDEELGFAKRDEDEEDKTVTARSRRRPLGALNTDVPPVPPLPSSAYLPTIPSGDTADPYQMQPSPFPRSPTLSVFSIPTTTGSGGGNDSVQFGSTAHLALGLRRTGSTGSNKQPPKLSNRFPAASPSRGQKERRRLRKKSRPPHLDGNIIELEDKAEHQGDVAEYTHVQRPVTPENRPSTPPPRDPGPSTSVALSPMSIDLDQPISHPPPVTHTNKSPLLARIGSMKRWSAGVRRKRASAGPNDVEAPSSTFTAAAIEAERLDNNRTPRARPQSTASPPSAMRTSRFFRRDSVGLDEAPVERERGQLKTDMQEERSLKNPSVDELPLSSEPAVDPSPRKARMKSFGQRSIKGSSDLETAESAVKGTIDGDGDVKMLSPPQLPSDRQPRIRPRLPHQAPSALKTNTLFPRHVSGPAGQDVSAASSRAASSAMSSTRSVSTSNATTSTGLTSIRTASNSTTNESILFDKSDGSRSFMGSIRRASLVGSPRRHRRSKSGGAEVTTTPLEIPPVPVLVSGSVLTPITASSDSSPALSALLPAAEISPSSKSRTRIQISHSDPPEPVPMDLASPKDPSASPPLLVRASPRRSPGDKEPTLTHSKSSTFTPSPSSDRNSPSRISPHAAASLGRAYQLPAGGSASSNVLRRNSLGDLKIPSRISRAQDGLKRDLTRVREFAAHVEHMKELRSDYYTLVHQIQTSLESRPPSRAMSPTFFNLTRPTSRARSNTNPLPPRPDNRQLSSTFYTIDSKYRVAWECADLLIDLGAGAGEGATHESGSKSAPSSSRHGVNVPRSRERAVTLAGDEGKPNLEDIIPISPIQSSIPTLLSWRASTGRHDLNRRQLFLLKEMLNNSDPAKEGSKLDVPGHGQTLHWRMNEGMESTLTLPTEDSNSAHGSSPKKRSSSKSRMMGIRDMLRALKRNHSKNSQQDVTQSTTTLNTESSHDTNQRHVENNPYYHEGARTTGRRRSKTSCGPESVRVPSGGELPYMNGIAVTHKSSPRRPSLASLFRLGQKQKSSGSASATDQSLDKSSRKGEFEKDEALANGRSASTTTADDDESDWDRMDSSSDVDVVIEAIANELDPKGTLKKSRNSRNQDGSLSRPATPGNPFAASQASLVGSSASHLRSRLSNVDENKVSSTIGSRRRTPASPEQRRPRSRGATTGKDRSSMFASVRSVPPPNLKEVSGLPVFDVSTISDLKLAMTPENIKPLLDNARVVTARLKDCVSEVRALVDKAEV